MVTLYSAYLCYSALISEPHDYICNGLGHRLNAASASTLAAGMALTLLSVVYSALRAGSNTQLFSFGLDTSSNAGDEAMESLLETGEAGDAGLTSAGLDGETTMTRPASGKAASGRVQRMPITVSGGGFSFAVSSLGQYLLCQLGKHAIL